MREYKSKIVDQLVKKECLHVYCVFMLTRDNDPVE